MKNSSVFLLLLLACFQLFSQEETKKSFGAQMSVAASDAYQIGTEETGHLSLVGVGACFSIHYKHDVINSRFRISPVFQVGFYSDDSESQSSYKTTSMMFNFECDAIRYKSFNLMLYGGGGVISGSAMCIYPIGYTDAGYNYGFGFRFEPKDAPISLVVQPLNVQRGTMCDIISANFGFDIHF